MRGPGLAGYVGDQLGIFTEHTLTYSSVFSFNVGLYAQDSIAVAKSYYDLAFKQRYGSLFAPRACGMRMRTDVDSVALG